MKNIQVFISYSKEDEKIAKRLHKDLNRNGIKAWLDSENLLPGQQWKNIINNAIEESDYLIALLSMNSISKKGYVHKELKKALEKIDELPSPSDIFLIPVRIEECRSLDEKLKNIHWVDIFPSYQDGFNKILRVFNNAKDIYKKTYDELPKYPYENFNSDFREIIAPKKYSNSILHIVFGNIADIREMVPTIPVSQDIDFWQRGPKSVLGSFESIRVGNEYFFNAIEKIWPKNARPANCGIGHSELIELPENSNLLKGVLFVVTTRNLSKNKIDYGRYVNTPIEGLEYVLDNVFETVKYNKIKSIALPLLGTGYANIGLTFDKPDLKEKLKKIVLALTIFKIESSLIDPDNELSRGVIVISSSNPQSTYEHKMFEFIVKFINKNHKDKTEVINNLLQQFI